VEVPSHFDLFSYLTRGSPAFGAAPPSPAPPAPGKPRGHFGRYDLRVAPLVAEVKRLRAENAALRKKLAARGGAARQGAGRRPGPVPRPSAASPRREAAATAAAAAPASEAVIEGEVVEVQDDGNMAEVIEFPTGDPWGADSDSEF
jgi:hypothetical protein